MSEIIETFFTIVYSWTTILQLAVVSFSVTYTLVSFEKSWKGLCRFLIYTAAMFVLESVLDLGFFILAQYVPIFFGINFPLAHLVAISLFMVFLSNYNIRSRLIMGLTMFIVAISMSELGQKAVGYWPDIPFVEWSCVTCDAVIVLSSLYVKHFTVENYTEIPVTSVVLTALNVGVSLVYIILMVSVTTDHFTFYAYDETDGRAFWALVLVSLIVILVSAIVCYTVVYRHSKENAERVLAELEAEQLKANERVMAVSDQAIEEMREIRHDIANQYTVIGMLLKEKKYGELENYFTGMNIELESSIRFIKCGNPVADSIINSEIMKAQSKGVQIVSIVKIPEKMGIESGDLGKLLFNLIDNAIEAIEREEPGKKTVELSMFVKNDYLFVSVRNPLPDQAAEQSAEEMVEETSKDDKERHGYGHRIVRKIVRKYKGEINYMREEGEFVAEAMLDLRSAKGESV